MMFNLYESKVAKDLKRVLCCYEVSQQTVKDARTVTHTFTFKAHDGQYEIHAKILEVMECGAFGPRHVSYVYVGNNTGQRHTYESVKVMLAALTDTQRHKTKPINKQRQCA